MKTEDLIRALAADGAEPPVPVARRFWLALPIGVLVAAALFLVELGLRPDFASAASQPRFLFKFMVTLVAAGTAVVAALRLARPTGRLSPVLLAAPVLLLAGVAGEMMAMPADTWAERLAGNNALICLTAIPLLSLPVLAAGLYALRQGAPARPAQAGAVAGLLSAGVAATLYASHCTDDSPLFVATWYPLAAGIVTLAGAGLGRRLLRW